MAKYSFSFLDNACFGHYDGNFTECKSKCKSSKACMAATESDRGDEVRRKFKNSSREIAELVDSFGGKNDSFRERVDPPASEPVAVRPARKQPASPKAMAKQAPKAVPAMPVAPAAPVKPAKPAKKVQKGVAKPSGRTSRAAAEKSHDRRLD